MRNLYKAFLYKKSLFLVAFIVLVALSTVYGPALTGYKEFYPNDKISSINVKEAVNQSDDYPYWFPWMMGGVPSVHSFQNVSDYYFPNYFMKFFKFLGFPWFWNFVFHLLFAGLGMYLLVRLLDINRFSALIASLSFSLMPYMTAMLVHGHGSQIMTIAYMPWVFYGYLKMEKNMSLVSLGVFALLLGLQLLRGHVQMAYYTWLMLSIYILIDFIYRATNKKIDFKFIFYTFSGLILGVLVSLSLYIPVLSYTPFSNRSVDSSGGMGFENATAWSFSFGEMITFIIPSFYGFGKNTYWGSMPSTDFPNYMGIILILLSVYGIMRFRWSKFKIFCIITGLLFLVLSFGGYFYQFCYNYIPLFSKFRNPMYLLIVVQFCAVVLGAMGLKAIYDDIVSRKRIVLIFCSFCILFFSIIPIVSYNMIGDVVQSLSFEGMQKTSFYMNYKDYLGNPDFYINRGSKLVREMSLSDLRTMSLIVFIFFCVIVLGYLFYNRIKSEREIVQKVSLCSILSIMAFTLFFDFYSINKRIAYRDQPEYFLSGNQSDLYDQFYAQDFAGESLGEIVGLKIFKNNPKYLKSDIVKNVLSLKDGSSGLDKFFRVYDQARGGSNEWARYHIENISGYHPAGLKSYKEFSRYLDGQPQDLVGRSEFPYQFDMLNVKLLILGEVAFENQSCLDRAFFVEQLLLDIDDDKSKRASLYTDLLISPSQICYITGNSDKLNIPWAAPDLSLNTSFYSFDVTLHDKVVDIISVSPNKLRIEVETSGPQFLAISEIYYPNGWYATINGENTDIFELNDLIRGVFIDSPGTHSIEMHFSPSDLKWGRAISWLSLLLVFSLIFFKSIRRFQKKYY